MIDQTDPEIEHSPLSRDVTCNGINVKVQIYRLQGTEGGWSLEVVDHQGASTVCSDLFATDRDAYEEFERTVTTEGIGTFLNDPTSNNRH